MHHERYAVSNHRRLAAPMRCYRIGDPSGAYPVYGAEGARRVGGRWHDRGDAVIYASRHYSTAMLERLEMGRASCWERVCQSVEVPVVAVSLKKKKIAEYHRI